MAGLQWRCFALWHIQGPLLQNLQYLVCHICRLLVIFSKQYYMSSNAGLATKT